MHVQFMMITAFAGVHFRVVWRVISGIQQAVGTV